MSDENFLREDLIVLRKRLGLTQTEMADRLDMSLGGYQAIESASLRIATSTAWRLSV